MIHLIVEGLYSEHNKLGPKTSATKKLVTLFYSMLHIYCSDNYKLCIIMELTLNQTLNLTLVTNSHYSVLKCIIAL